MVYLTRICRWISVLPPFTAMNVTVIVCMPGLSAGMGNPNPARSEFGRFG